MSDISHVCLCLVENFEQCRLVGYRDAVGVPTIGWGTTNGISRFAFKVGQRISQEKADDLLRVGLRTFNGSLDAHVKVDLQQYERDALCAFIYNVGGGHFASSTLLSRLNRGDRKGAAAQFMAWTHAGGRVLPGLVTRRHCEATLFTGDIKGALAQAIAHGQIPDHPDAQAQAQITPVPATQQESN